MIVKNEAIDHSRKLKRLIPMDEFVEFGDDSQNRQNELDRADETAFNLVQLYKGKLMPIFANARDNTSYSLLMRQIEALGAKVGCRFEVQEIGSHQADSSTMHDVLIIPHRNLGRSAFDVAPKISDATDSNVVRPLDVSSCAFASLTLKDVRSLNCASESQKLPELLDLTLEHGATLPGISRAAQGDASAAKDIAAAKAGDVQANKLFGDCLD